MATDISLPDYLAIRNAAFEWSDSYDTKDWERLKKCLAPSISLDFTYLQGPLHENLTPDEYAAILSDKGLIGDPRLKTQHFLGISKWEVLDDSSVLVSHKIRVAHQRYEDEDFATVKIKGHAHGVTQHWYRKVDGVWKIEGVKPRLDWVEHDFLGTFGPNH